MLKTRPRNIKNKFGPHDLNLALKVDLRPPRLDPVMAALCHEGNEDVLLGFFLFY